MSEITTNPLLQNFNHKDQAVPFDLVQTHHYIPAVNEAIKLSKAKLDTFKQQKTITFENTILALEQISEPVDRISGIYFNLFSA